MYRIGREPAQGFRPVHLCIGFVLPLVTKILLAEKGYHIDEQEKMHDNVCPKHSEACKNHPVSLDVEAITLTIGLEDEAA